MHQGCRFNIRMGHTQESTNECTNEVQQQVNGFFFLSLSYFLPSSLKLKKEFIADISKNHLKKSEKNVNDEGRELEKNDY